MTPLDLAWGCRVQVKAGELNQKTFEAHLRDHIDSADLMAGNDQKGDGGGGGGGGGGQATLSGEKPHVFLAPIKAPSTYRQTFFAPAIESARPSTCFARASMRSRLNEHDRFNDDSTNNCCLQGAHQPVRRLLTATPWMISTTT